ncbi:MAG: hypothetical protein ACRCR2_02595 [Fusobacteriaceae bacterium]
MQLAQTYSVANKFAVPTTWNDGRVYAPLNNKVYTYNPLVKDALRQAGITSNAMKESINMKHFIPKGRANEAD